MKNFTFILAFLVLIVADFVFAQDGSDNKPPSDKSSSSEELTIPDVRFSKGTVEEIDQEMNILVKQLKLTEDQKKKARIIIEERQKKALEVRDVLFPVSKPGESPKSEGGEAMTKVLKESHEKMLTILNEEQKKIFDEIDPNVKDPF